MFIVGIALVACGGATSSGPGPAVQAHLMRLDELAAGKLDALPTGGQFVRVVAFQQPPGETFPSRKHQAGIIYEQTGVQQFAYTGGPSLDIGAGTALYSESSAHSHANTGSTANAWYFIALWPSIQRGAPLVVATSRVAFETQDIPSSTLRTGSYVETLRRVALQAGGHSAARRFGGLEVVFVIDGILTVDTAGHRPVRLSAGQGTYVAPDTPTQAVAGGGGAASYLAFFVTRQGLAFEAAISSAPPS